MTPQRGHEAKGGPAPARFAAARKERLHRPRHGPTRDRKARSSHDGPPIHGAPALRSSELCLAGDLVFLGQGQGEEVGEELVDVPRRVQVALGPERVGAQRLEPEGSARRLGGTHPAR